jgi:hypothetical protein
MQPNHSARLKTPWTSKSIPENMRSAGPSNREVVEALQTRVTGMQKQMGQIQRELDGSRSQMVQDEGTMGHLRRRIEELEELVQKQKATIANQSKAISDPRTGRRQQQNQQQNQPKQPGNGIVYPATPHHNHQGPSAPYQTPASMRSQHSVASANVFDCPPPRFELQAVNGAAPAPGPGTGPATAPGPSTNAFGNGIPHVTGPRLHFTYAEIEKHSTDLGKRLQGLFGKMEQWGQAHANVPNVYRDSRLEKRVKEYIMSVSDASTASHLLGNVKTRYFLVAKAINFYLVNEVLKITAVRGFDAVVDAEIEGLKGQLFPGKLPCALRAILLRVFGRYTLQFASAAGRRTGGPDGNREEAGAVCGLQPGQGAGASRAAVGAGGASDSGWIEPGMDGAGNHRGGCAGPGVRHVRGAVRVQVRVRGDRRDVQSRGNGQLRSGGGGRGSAAQRRGQSAAGDQPGSAHSQRLGQCGRHQAGVAGDGASAAEAAAAAAPARVFVGDVYARRADSVVGRLECFETGGVGCSCS